MGTTIPCCEACPFLGRGLRYWILCCCFWALTGVCHLPAVEPPATFVRGFNLNGPPLKIDGHAWQGNDSPDVRIAGGAFDNQAIRLTPPTDPARAQMLRSSRWGRSIELELLNLPVGDYQVVLYAWEDNSPTRFDVLLNDQVVLKDFDSGKGGSWHRLGPWPVKSVGGAIKLAARGGDANLSGVEIWSGTGRVPTPDMSGFNSQPTPEQLAFFENKIRPLLIEHCYSCHSAEADEVAGGLLLDSRAAIVRGGDTEPPIVPYDSEHSLLVKAVKRRDADLQMPPDTALSATEIADLEKWINDGAPDPRTENTLAVLEAKTAIDWDNARDFWSLKPLSKAKTPTLEGPAAKWIDWCSGDIDHYIVTAQIKVGLQPNVDAPAHAWLRRATYDLTGLPPTAEEIEAFANDTSPDAYQRVVDRLLASTAYGERWGRYWLDVVRYSDTAGDNSDFPIPQMVKYRDWVIDALNRDMPYDHFVTMQLAGDLLPADSHEQRCEQIIATGYIAGARRFGSRVDDYPQHLTIEDTLDNLGRAFLASTVSCARCHDHKFDPITTADYYGLYGIFHSTRYPWPGIELEQKQRDLVPLVPADQVEKHLAERASKQKELDAEVKRLTAEAKAAKDEAKKAIDAKLKGAKKAAEEHAKSPLPFEQAYAVIDAPRVEDVAIQIKGDPAKLGPVVPRHFLTMLGGATLPTDERSSGRRQLAEWIVDPKNPLTARVMANRIWLHHFGRGLVATPNDFGRQGKPPSHPELLDWLAARLMESDWSIKALHREIMLSHTYRQSSQEQSQGIENDPTNQWLSAFPRRRLDAEAIRDSLLSLGGSLQRGTAAPHPFPPQQEWKFTQHNPFKAIYETNHRSVYLMTQRIQRHPFLAIFDGPDPATSSPIRLTSTTPLQALYFLNDPLVHEQANRFAQRLVTENDDDEQRLARAYTLCFAREPSEFEQDRAREFLTAVRAHLTESGIEERDLELETWKALVRALLRTNEFVMID